MGCGWLLISIMGVPVLSGKSSNWGWPDKNVEKPQTCGLNRQTNELSNHIWTIKHLDFNNEIPILPGRVKSSWLMRIFRAQSTRNWGPRLETNPNGLCSRLVSMYIIHIYIYRYTSVRLFMYILKWLYIYMLMQYNYPFYTHYTPTGHCSR